jgi:hypothetical protein
MLLLLTNVQLSGQTLFSDDLESGTSAWTIFPGTPICTSPQYVSTATDLNANHTPGGSYGYKLTNASDRVYHDISLASFPTNGVHFSVWYYDTLDTRAYSFEPFDVRTTNSSQVLGLGAYYGIDYYMVRILKDAGGFSPNWIETSIYRTPGWHQFELYQYRGQTADTVDFYIDSTLAYHTTSAQDGTLNRVVLGLGFANNIYQSGYVDDISVTQIPELRTLTFLALVLGVGYTVMVRLKRETQRRASWSSSHFLWGRPPA